MKKVLLVQPFKAEHIERLYNTENYILLQADNPTAEELKEASIILGMPTVDQLQKAENLEWVQISSAGNEKYINGFPKGVILTNLSGAFGRSMSEFALMMTLNLYKMLHLYRDNQSNAYWHDEGRQLSPRKKNVLLLGAGNIASETAELFKAFECNITAIRRASDIKAEYPFDRFEALASLDEELKKADIVICALPETKETKKLLNKERLSLLKSDSVLINLGRGSLIDTDALVEILNENRILGAALDVTEPEPLPEEHPLWKCKNAIITPHITGGSLGHLDETERRLFEICSENLQRYSEGRPLLNRVDFSSGYRQIENRKGEN